MAGTTQVIAPPRRSGIWEGFVPDVQAGDSYKYHIVSRVSRHRSRQGRSFRVPYRNSTAHRLDRSGISLQWNDQAWMSNAGPRSSLHAPMSIYEVHLGSWRRLPEDDNRSLSYREIAEPLGGLCRAAGLHPRGVSAVDGTSVLRVVGISDTGYFAPTSRYGTPQDLMYLIDYLHQRGIGVILDWVPSHFPTDEWALGISTDASVTNIPIRAKAFTRTGTATSSTTAATRSEASCSAARCSGWTNTTSTDCAWTRSRRCSISTIRARKASGFPTSTAAAKTSRRSIFCAASIPKSTTDYPDVQTIAEESTAWPMVSRPTYVGGLGFGFKWDMGWMHDTLEYS